MSARAGVPWQPGSGASLRVLLTTDYYWPHLGGGVEVVVQQLAERLARRGHTVAVATLNTQGAPPYERHNDVTIYRMPAVDLTRWVGLQLAVPLAPYRLRQLVRSWQPDVLHLHNRFFTTSLVGTLVRGSTPTVFTLHLGPVTLGKAVGLYEQMISLRLLRAADLVTAVGPVAAQVWPGAVVIPNGVDTAAFRPATTPVEGFQVMCVGRLIQNKGPDRVLEAVPLMDRAVAVVFIGDGPMRPFLEERAQALGIADRVTFLGTRSDVQHLLPSGSVLVRASDTEGMSLSVLEALACGLPVIGSPAACAGLVQHGVQGYQLQDLSPAEIAHYVNALYRNPQTSQEMARAARQVAEAYSWEQAVDAYESAYADVRALRAATPRR